jgi:hypothetical protein
MKAGLGFALAVITGIAYLYGYSFSLTVEGFPIQGYVGALIPCTLVFMGVAIGASLAYLDCA